MPNTSVRISDLSALSAVKRTDFIAVVQSGSAANLTTYRVPLSVLDALNAASGSALSAFYASSSLSSSYARLSDSASYLYPTILYRATVTSSVSSSWSAVAFSSSNALSSSNAFTASYSKLSDSASYLYPTILYNATVTASVSSSWSALARTASWAQNGLTTASHYPVTTSYADTASFILGGAIPTGLVAAWTPTVFGVTSAPNGWLYADGAIFNQVTYASLAALIGTNYGRPITTSVQIRAETTNAYHSAHDGLLKVLFQGGGSGTYSFTSGSVTFFVSNDGNISFTHCNSGPFTTVITDLDVTPAVSYPQTYTIPYGPSGTSTTNSVILGSPQYRTPNFTASYYAINTSPIINPISYIIKT